MVNNRDIVGRLFHNGFQFQSQNGSGGTAGGVTSMPQTGLGNRV